MKIEEGMHVRTNFYDEIVIRKIDRIVCDKPINMKYLVFDKPTKYIYYIKQKNFKASHNIIDLIEVGDYVNGIKITLIHEPSLANCNKRIIYAEDEKGYLIEMFDDSEIKSIVTKEQFESINYKLD